MRTTAEWLLLPLFLLPFGIGGGLLWLAADLHRKEIEPYLSAGESRVKALLTDPSREDWLASAVRREIARGRKLSGGGIGFSHPGGRGLVRMSPGSLGNDPWVVTRVFPSGLLPEALADADVRLRVETGVAPSVLEGADRATIAFRRLYLGRDLEGLRTAPLPASTKLYLVKRWRKDAPDDETLARAEKLLATIATATAHWPLPPGAHRFGEVTVLAGEGGVPALVYPDRGSLPPPIRHRVGPDTGAPIELVWRFPAGGEVPAGALWTGDLEEPWAGRFQLVCRDGREWWQSGRFRRWAGPAGAGLVLLLLIPVGLLVSMRRRRRLGELRVRFLNELAHDLRTPLTSLRLYAEMLAGGKSREGDRDRYLGVIVRESVLLTSLLGNLLDLSRLEGNRRPFEPETLDLDEVAEQAAGEFVALYPKRADDIRVCGEDGARVRADRAALSRCLVNLLDNAGKFTGRGTPITLSWERAGGRVQIVVRDGGPGIPVSERDRVFERFTRGRETRDGGVPGTGLGLSIVRDLCRGMGGAVRLLPDPGGAAFEIDLPGVAP